MRFARLAGVTIYFLRHGIAERLSPGGDRTRSLTEAGKEELRRVLAWARQAQVKPDLVLSSPYVRAAETGRLAIQELDVEQSLSFADELVPDSTPQDLWRELRVQGAESILVVSHEPLLSATVAWFLGSTKEIVCFPARQDWSRSNAESTSVPSAMLPPG